MPDTAPAATLTLADLPELDVFSPKFADDPHALLRPLRAEHELARSERGLEVLSYAACQQVYRHPELAVGQREAYIASGISSGRFFDTFLRNINNVEGDLHLRLRKVLVPFFSPARVEALRARTRQMIDAWLDDVGGDGECDLMAVLAQPLPSSVFCFLIGAPLDDQQRVAQLSVSLVRFFLRDPAYRDEILGAFEEVSEYANDLLTFRETNPSDDLITGLVEAERRGDLDREESVTMVITLLTGSTDTTSGQLGLGIIALHENKEQWHVLTRNPDHVPTAVVELARYRPGVWSTARTAREGTDFLGVSVEPGTGVYSDVIAANRDPAIFDSPDTLDVTRKAPHPPLTWGLGHHFCVGRPLAVMELEEAFRSLLERWSDFEIVGDPEIIGVPFLVTPLTLPIRFSPKRAA